MYVMESPSNNAYKYLKFDDHPMAIKLSRSYIHAQIEVLVFVGLKTVHFVKWEILANAIKSLN
jgi:hypothetical protein